MKKMMFYSFSALMFLGMHSCFSSIDKKLLLGEWKGTEWLMDGKPASYNAAETYFTFGPKGRYTYAYAGTIESGKYHVANNELFTTPEGGIQMMVKIRKLTPDSLVFEMNRGGTPEQLTLIRKE